MSHSKRQQRISVSSQATPLRCRSCDASFASPDIRPGMHRSTRAGRFSSGTEDRRWISRTDRSSSSQPGQPGRLPEWSMWPAFLARWRRIGKRSRLRIYRDGDLCNAAVHHQGAAEFQEEEGFYDFESRADGVGKLESLSAETPERWSIAVIAGFD